MNRAIVAGDRPKWRLTSIHSTTEDILFIRSAKGVSLTERGAHLRESVQDVFAELEQILQELDRTREVNGTLTLAASTTVARYLLLRCFLWLVSELGHGWDSQVELAGSVVGGGSEVDEIFKSPSHSLC
jgi:hypothetical protein